MDIDTVFRNADIDDNIWVEIPEGTNLAANDDGIHKLHKSLYGQKQAITNWNNDINQYLIDITNLLEADMWNYVKNIEINSNGTITKQYLMVALYVYDILIAVYNTKNLVTKLEVTMRQSINKLNVIKQLILLGMEIFHDNKCNTIYITQQ